MSVKNVRLLVLLLLYSCNLNSPDCQSNDWLTSSETDYLTKSMNDLSETLDQKSTLTGIQIDSLNLFLKKLFELKKLRPGLSKETWASVIDSISKSWNLKMDGRTVVTADKDYVTPEYLERQTDLALTALREAGWNSSVSFEDFCEYVLPYKLTAEIADNWRDTLYRFHRRLVADHPGLRDLDSLYSYHKINTYNALDKKIRLKKFFPSEDNFSWLSFSMEGDCSSRCRYMICYLRAAGVPATYDNIPAWGNRPYARHAYVGLANRQQQVKKLLENINDPGNQINDLNATVTDTFLYVFPKNEMPGGLYIQYEKTIPKIYRETWTAQQEILKLYQKVPQDELYTKLIRANMTDVTAQYLVSATVELRKKVFSRPEMAYLSVFDQAGWMPVAFSRFNWQGKAVFQHMGKNIVYMPMIMEDSQLTLLSDPFVLNNRGEKNFLFPDYEKRINMHLIRKYPLFAYSAIHVASFKDAVFKGANKPDFSDAKDIYTINEYPFFILDADIPGTDRFQYIRLDTKNGEKARIEMMEFYTVNKEGKLQHLKGKISRVEGLLQMKLDSACNISKIKVWPHNDMNYIIPGNSYELFYWDKEWISAGVKTASDFHIEYSGIPSGTLYWLRCLTEGKEERIFTYENGKQIWW